MSTKGDLKVGQGATR